MSSITFGTTAVLPARPATRLRLTVRGRRVLLAIAALPLAVGLVFAAVGGGSAIASGQETGTVDFETMMVLPGDSLWSIAQDIAPGTDPRTVIDEITQLNALPDGALMVGQELAIPAQYAN